MAGCLLRRSFLRSILAGGVLILLEQGAAGQPLQIPKLGIVSATYRDLDGDLDPFPDSGESGRLVLTIRNGGVAYTNAILTLVSSDPDVECITERRVAIGDLAPSQVVEAGSADPGIAGFAFKVAPTLSSTSGADPARIDLCLRLRADQIAGLSGPLCFFLPADLDLPGGATSAWIAGPDEVLGSADDGTLLENFDVDRDGDGRFTVKDTFRLTDSGTGLTGHGGYARTGAYPGDVGLLLGVVCGGFSTISGGNSICLVDPDYPMDWHLHCPPGAGNCPNVETGPCVDGVPGAACTYDTPTDGRKASSPPNSLHMGLHFVGRDARWDTTRFRALQAFVSAPLNLVPSPRPGDLQLSMLHIADLMDNNGVLTPGRNECEDCGDVQIQADLDADPALDEWGPWDKLAPFQNVYDHVAHAWTTFSSYYCRITPGDAGTDPPAPYGFHETMCFPQGVWSHCGSVRGTTPDSVYGCQGPGILDPTGSGVWVETRFDLSSYRGQRIRIRWIGSTWAFDGPNSHYGTVGGGWETGLHDDGWWLDDIRVTGVLTSQTTPIPDTDPDPGGACPDVCNDIDEDGYGFPGAVVCPAGSQPDCNDLEALIFPGTPERCNRIDDDCDGAVPPAERDTDGDQYTPCEGDCDDRENLTHPWAVEWNDGKDNQCPGYPGYGLVDEIQDPIRFQSQGRLVWQRQELAAAYEVARSTRPDFSTQCAIVPVLITFWEDSEAPVAGGALFYLVRPSSPHVGSWGAASFGTERTVPCAP